MQSKPGHRAAVPDPFIVRPRCEREQLVGQVISSILVRRLGSFREQRLEGRLPREDKQLAEPGAGAEAEAAGKRTE